ncbi:hypothetical protein GGR54DRAFT_644596 [Hypoxylon sp. NC1633]|nr:hypothetical protein GGR54DRAFT_644596 [Hypoxylon sp. NC1633]
MASEDTGKADADKADTEDQESKNTHTDALLAANRADSDKTDTGEQDGDKLRAGTPIDSPIKQTTDFKELSQLVDAMEKKLQLANRQVEDSHSAAAEIRHQLYHFGQMREECERTCESTHQAAVKAATPSPPPQVPAVDPAALRDLSLEDLNGLIRNSLKPVLRELRPADQFPNEIEKLFNDEPFINEPSDDKLFDDEVLDDDLFGEWNFFDPEPVRNISAVKAYKTRKVELCGRRRKFPNRPKTRPENRPKNDGRPNDERPNDGRPNDELELPNDERPNDERPNDERPNDERPNEGHRSNAKTANGVKLKEIRGEYIIGSHNIPCRIFIPVSQ